MDASYFDIAIHALTTGSSRRAVLPRLATAALGVGFAGRVPPLTRAKKRRKKVKRNAFGCVNVGKPCRGKDSVCCSGICRGQKPKPGKKVTSRCVAHDASTCQPGQNPGIVCGGTNDPCVTSLGETGFCATTTGNAGYCFNAIMINGTCVRDADCQDGGGPSAACIHCLTSGETRCTTFDEP